MGAPIKIFEYQILFYFMNFYVIFIIFFKVFDPGEVLYIYESPAGVGLCIMKVIVRGSFFSF